MKYKIRAGYNMFNKGSGLLNEKIELKNVINKCEEYLTKLGHQLVNNNADWNIYLRLNSGKLEINDTINRGVRAYVYQDSIAYGKAIDIVTAISTLGFKYHGVKFKTKGYGLSSSPRNSILLFCCFNDNGIDYTLFNADKMAKAIVEGITGESVDKLYQTVYDGVDYGLVYNYQDYIKNYPMFKDMTPDEALEYFVKEGMGLAHKGKDTFDVHFYVEQYPELSKTFGANYKAYYTHYMQHGYFEHRNAYNSVNTKDFGERKIKVIAKELPLHIDAGKGYGVDGYVYSGDELTIIFVRDSYGLVANKNRWINISTKCVKYIGG